MPGSMLSDGVLKMTFKAGMWPHSLEALSISQRSLIKLSEEYFKQPTANI